MKTAKHINTLSLAAKTRSYRVLLVFVASMCASFSSQAQCEVVISGSAVISVPAGTGFGTEGNITLNNTNGAIDNSGTVHISGNWTNNAASGGLINASTGTVVLEGANQSIAGTSPTTFHNLTLQGTGIKSIVAASSTVSSVLNLTDRELATGPNFLVMTTTASVTYTVGSGFISSTLGGYLQRNTNSTALYHCPVGRPGGGLFRPLDISPATTTSNSFRVRQVSNSPTTDGYAHTTTDGTICIANTAYYHLITQTGADNALLTMYFSSAIDGNLTRMAHWQTPGPAWTNMNPVTLNAGNYGLPNGISRANWSNFTTPAFALAFPPTPLTPVASAATSIACNSFSANWSASTDASHLSTDIDRYYLDVATDAGFTSIVSGYNGLDVGNGATYSVTGLSTGTNYYYRLRAYNVCGTSGNSNTIGPVQTITASVAPTSLSAAVPSPVCPGYSSTLTQSGGSLGTGTSWKWYSDNTYTTLVGTGTGANASLVVTPAVTTTYYLRIEGGTFPCTANLTGPVGGVTVTVQVVPTLAALTGNQSIICGGTTTFSNQPTGGDVVTTSGGYRIHTFLSSGTFNVPSSLLGTIDVLVVAGGGGGGSDMGGGGGGGGVIYSPNFSVTPGSSIAVTVGAGGNGALNGTNQARGINGGNSIFSSLTAIGGGGGASDHDAAGSPAGSGGSGGGASGRNANAGTGTGGQGFNGSTSAGSWYPGGGGGAGGAGGTNPANGGAGVSNSILGTAYFWGAGGGGAGYTNIAGNGGQGGGGGGAPRSGAGGVAGSGGLNAGYDGSVGQLGQQTQVPGGNGAPNTGAGGGGGAHYSDGNHGGNGGSGIVVVRYADVTNGVWSSNNTGIATVDANGVVTGVSTGTAIITYQLSIGGCTSIASVSRTVTVSLPTLDAITGTTSICVGSTSTLASTPKATGGTESVLGGYRIHTFLSSGTLNVTQSGNMDVFVVAGGGGGGTNMGGGGGGGGVIASPSFPVSTGSIAITVGAGGNGAPAGTCSNPGICHPTVPASNGANSAFGLLTAIGGGAGGTSPTTLGIAAGSNGGSGGGASGYNNSGGQGDTKGGNGTPGQGFMGGYQGTAYYSGGGGGAGGPGSSGNDQANGGPGISNSILGTAYFWAGGGGGAAYSAANGGNGGSGGGGGGAVGTTTGGAGLNNGSAGGGGCSGCWANTPGGDAGANTGGGGGGGAHYYSGNKGGNGGSGIVVVKYLDGANGTWSSLQPSIATVNASTGVVTGVAAGTATIKYTLTIGSCVSEQTTTVTVGDATISSATATPATICPGDASNLNAVSVGNNINWFTTLTGGTAIGSSASAANYSVAPSITTTYYAEAATVLTGSQTFNYSGGIQAFTVPPLVTSITIDAYGAQGSNAQTVGGLGGRAQGALAVTPGQIIYVHVGGQGGFNGGGPPGVGGTYPGAYGGGASDLRIGGIGIANRVIVAGGGGGGGTSGALWAAPGPGGVGGGTTGGTPTLGSTWNPPSGGTQVGGGVVGISCSNCGNTATNGSLGQGGRGDYACLNYGTGSGGGGGYYGGAGGESCGNGEPGGGGSSYTGGVVSGTTTSGVRSGNGQVVISWTGDGCLSTPRTAVVVTVNLFPTDIIPTASPASVCTNSGTNIQIASSQSGVNYQLRNNIGNSNVGSPVAGTGGTINLPTGNLTATTTFNVLATNTTTTCQRQMTNTVTVTVYPYPLVGTISGTSPICEGYTTALTVNPPSGGTVTTSGGYTIHTFTSSGTFSPPTTFTGTVEVLAVAGGGGGAASIYGGGGGGGGGVIHHTVFPVVGGTPITVTVGGGGGTSAAGGDSYFGAMRAFGGGGACSNCGPGGSGGGTTHSNPGGGNNASTQTSNNGGTGYGNVGGNAVYTSPYWMGSGGGAGAAGVYGGAGGAGLAFSISGGAVTYAGGGGQCNNSGGATAGGTGGGGAGANGNAVSGTANTGGGGGGSRGGAAGSGGSGIVILRYPTPPVGVWSSNSGNATVNGSGVVSGVTAGSATISYSVTQNGCTTTATFPITVNPTPAAPTSVTATPPIICTTAISNLNATSTGNTIRWWDAATGGTLLGTTASAVNFSVSPLTTTTYYAEAYNPSNCASTSRTAVTVTVQLTPATPSPITGETTFCVGATSALTSPIATGGDVSFASGYRIHTFYSSGTLNIAQDANVEVLVVAGGGGGGMDMGGGGGGGGVIANSSFSVSFGSYPITVGAGGRGGPPASTAGQPAAHQYTVSATNGGNSTFSTLTAIGGGYGGSSYFGYTPNNGYGAGGGSGGGASGYSDGNTGRNGAGTVGQGNRGGTNSGQYYSGGGGGAGGAGTDGPTIAHGGSGISNSILGTAYYWGAGGGGAGHSTNGGNGGIGGGGGGASYNTVAGTGGVNGLNNGANGRPNTNAPGGNAGENTGSGGGGGSHYNSNNSGGTGGSGIVVVRYLEGSGIGTWSSSAPAIASVDANTGVVTGVAPGTATISYTVVQGICSSTPTTTTVTILDSPAEPTASDVAICAGQSTTISATSTGNLIKWYDAPTGGTLVGVTASGATLAVSPAITTTYYAEAISNNPYATGGTVTSSGAYRIHRFNATGTLDFLVGGKTEALVVAGGGGGGSDMGGGGGAGGVIENNSFTVAAGSFSITVGGGGNGAPAGIGQVRGTNGGNSIFSSLTAIGGGGGGSEYSTNASPPGNGGSGGGVAGCNQTTIGTGTVGQGYNGGPSGGCYFPSGGGGAGGAGMTRAAHGGPGIVSSILGTDYYFGGGGGGSGYSGNGGNGGKGGGGGGAVGVTLGGTGGLNNGSSGTYGGTVAWAQVPGGNAGANTGGGGGGGSHYNSNNYGGNGGSGIVVVRYLDAGCSSPRKPVIVTVNPLPTDITPTVVAATVCYNTGTNIQIASSQSGVSYQLRNNVGNTNVGAPVAGTGFTINLPTGNLTATTTYNVLGTVTATSCPRQMTGTVTVTVWSNLTGGSFIYTNPTSCTANNGTLTVSGISGGSGVYEYSVTSSNGSDGIWQASASFTGLGASVGSVWVRNTVVPNCGVNLGTYTITQPYSPIATPTATNNLPNLCNGNIATLTATGLAPGNGGSNTADGARSFNGGQYLSSPTSAGLPTGSIVTVEAWIKPGAQAVGQPYNGIVAYGTRGAPFGSSCLLSIQSDLRLSMATWGTAATDFVPTTGPSVVANVWTHVAMVINGTSVQFYINGQVAQSGTIPTPAIQATAAQTLTIGCSDVYARYFNGQIDNVRIWASARSQAELQADMYKEMPTTNAAALSALYALNGGSLSNSSGPGPALAVFTATPVAPAFYTYTWSGGLPAGIAPAGANPAPSTNEVQTSGTITGTSPFQVIASANGCSSAQSNVAASNDFAGGYTVTIETAGNGNAAAVSMPGGVGTNAYGLTGGGVTGDITAGTWNRCINWGLPTTSDATNGPRIGWFYPPPTGSAMTAMAYLTAGGSSTTDLANGKVCYSTFLTPPTGKFCTNAACNTFLSAPLQFRLTLSVVTVGNTPIPLDFISSGHIVMRATQNFRIKTFLEVYVPAGQYYSNPTTTNNGTLCSTVSGAVGSWVPALDWYDCMYKAGAPQFVFSFNYDAFPKFNGIGVSAGPDLSFCPEGTIPSVINITADDGSLTSTCGTILRHWEGPAGFTATGTLAAPTGSISISVNAQVAPPTTFGTYHYTVSQSPSNTCYDTDDVDVTVNTPQPDNTNFPLSQFNTNLATHWKTTLDPLGDTGPDNWFDHDNWTHCVPDLGVNAMIHQTTLLLIPDPLYQPIIASPGAKASAIIIETDNGARLTVEPGGILEVDQ